VRGGKSLYRTSRLALRDHYDTNPQFQYRQTERQEGGKEREPIAVVVEKLQQVLKNNPPPWLRKAMLKGERPN